MSGVAGPEGRQHPPLRKERMEILSLLSSHAATGAYLADMTKKIQSNECWWCGSGETDPPLPPEQKGVGGRRWGMRAEASAAPTMTTVRRMATEWLCGGASDGDEKRQNMQGNRRCCHGPSGSM